MKKWAVLLAIAALFGFGMLVRTQLGMQSDGSFLVSSGQRIQLLGQTTRLEGVRPKDMALSPDKSVVAILTHQKLILADLSGKSKGEIKFAAGPLGIAWSPDGSVIYCSLGTGKIGVFAWNGSALTKTKEFGAVPAGTKGNPGTGGLAVDAKGTLY